MKFTNVNKIIRNKISDSNIICFEFDLNGNDEEMAINCRLKFFMKTLSFIQMTKSPDQILILNKLKMNYAHFELH